MDCNIIKDLIPLYIDGCCSAESSETVKKHIDSCDKCRAVFESMNTNLTSKCIITETPKPDRINNWKASVLQSVLFLLSFLLITVGVSVEASTGSIDFGNGMAAFNAVVPATGFMLSLTNWYFVKLYRNRKIFSWCSCGLSVIISLCASLWCAVHYEFDFIGFFENLTFTDFAEHTLFFYGIGIALTVIFAAASKILSNLYAKMLGKE